VGETLWVVVPTIFDGAVAAAITCDGRVVVRAGVDVAVGVGVGLAVPSMTMEGRSGGARSVGVPEDNLRLATGNAESPSVTCQTTKNRTNLFFVCILIRQQQLLSCFPCQYLHSERVAHG
jgi:hypothetical protein